MTIALIVLAFATGVMKTRLDVKLVLAAAIVGQGCVGVKLVTNRESKRHLRASEIWKGIGEGALLVLAGTGKPSQELTAHYEFAADTFRHSEDEARTLATPTTQDLKLARENLAKDDTHQRV